MRLFHYFSEDSAVAVADAAGGGGGAGAGGGGAGAAAGGGGAGGGGGGSPVQSKSNKTVIGSSPHTDWGYLTVILQVIRTLSSPSSFPSPDDYD